MRRRLVVIGLDAADSRLVRRWASEGELPTIAKLMSEGATASVSTPIAVLEGGVWPTFLTSVSPATHGMLSYLQLKPGTYDLEVGGYADRLVVPPFWAQLSQAGKRVAVIDAPFARPLRGLNGIQVTNWGSHDPWAWKRSSWPPRLIRDVVARFGEHPVGLCDAPVRSLADYADLRARLIAGIETKAALLRHYLLAGDWDFFLGVFSESHCVGHQCWHLMDPAHPQHEPSAPAALHSAIRDVYRAIDDGVATILADRPADADVLLMLSHGMGPYYAGSHLLPAVLDRVLDGGPEPARPGTDHPGRRAMWGLGRLVPSAVRHRLRARQPEALRRLWRWAHPAPNPWRTARAFALPTNNMTGAVRINLTGRDPAGMVAPGREYEALCQTLTQELLALENVATGRPAVEWVRRASELYQGANLNDLPDLFIEWDHTTPITAVRSPRIGTVSRPFVESRTGDHRQGGLLVGAGPSFGVGEVGAQIRTEDIGPTILDFFGVAPAPAYEGRSALAHLRAPGGSGGTR
jgi:predicted AlkP superfamily phosphohydrolase/phosphomutase